MTSKNVVIDDLKVARALIDKAKREGVSLTIPEQDFVQDAMDAADDLATDEKTAQLDAITKAGGAASTPSGRGFLAPSEVKSTSRKPLRPVQESASYAKSFERYVRTGAMSDDLIEGKADLAEGTGAAGGFLVPDAWADQLDNYLADAAPMLEVSRNISVNRDLVHVPRVATHGAAAWTAEAGAFNVGDEIFGEVNISIFKATRITKVSEELLADNDYSVEGFLAEEFGRSFGAVVNTALTLGTAVGQPNGLVPKVGTAQIYTAGTGTTAGFVSDDFISIYHKLKSQYRKNAVWLMNDASISVARRLKDTTGQYLWQPGLQAGDPAMLLGKPVIENPDMASPGTSTLSVAFGDVGRGFYVATNPSGIAIQRLNELYAATGQVGFRGFIRIGSDLVNPESVVLGKHAAT